ncbi:MAG: T9SS type A sorting domain-containing protein [Bacteroidales bacterium]|nr:T9SS type A sorting domain-containing protein [Bacteroidales bacterium]
MKKLVLILLVIFFSFHLKAQISEGGLPHSYKQQETKSLTEIATYRLRSVDGSALAGLEPYNQLPLRYAVLQDVDIDIKKRATKTVLTNGGTIWQYRINSPAGKSLQVIFRKYLVPEGAELFLYNEDYSEIRGAFTDFNITDNLDFVTGDFPGDHVIIEYFEPSGALFEGEIIIGSVGQAYIDILGPKSGNIDDEGHIPINCIEGQSVQDQKHAVCRYTFNDGQSSYLCSGALIKTAGNSAGSYFLTAAHCLSTQQKAATVVAYFNYEEAACTALIAKSSQTISGSSLLTTGSQSDYTLLQFDRAVPFSYKPYYAGWDVTDSPPENSSCIHHPGGKTKKIALDFDSAGINEDILTWEGGGTSPTGTHWAVSFDEGITSPGSSGAPLLDQNLRITGQLHGGSITDYFGKLSYSWQNPDSPYPSLQSFLDPDNTGIRTVDGYYPPGNRPDPQFDSQLSSVCTGAPVELSGYSAFKPLEWSWTFSPNSVQYHDGTGSSSQTPKVSFMADGNYSVTLKVTNIAGQNELGVGNYISSGTVLDLKTYPAGMPDSCIVSFSGLKLNAYGADAYLWALSDNSDELFYIENNTANPVEIKLLDDVKLTKSTDLDITLTGIHGSCNSIIPITIPLTAQTNDFVRQAIPVKPGTSGPYSNLCASIEPGEPIPPFDDCTGQLSWCNEYGNGLDIVERSVWFTFTPEANQVISLSSSGFDNQIAVYSASSATGLLAGNYKLEAANDDYTETNADPFITSLDVKANQKYWIQVDGSAGGATGDFLLYLSVLSTVEETLSEDKINVYPQPAGDFVTIESAAFTRCASVRVELTDVTGRTVFNDNILPDAGRVQVPVGNMTPGIYLARLFCDGEVAVVRVVI